MRSAGLLWRASPGETTALVFLLILQGTVPAAAIHLSKLTVDGLIGGDYLRVMQLIAAWVATQFLGTVITPLNQILQGNIAERFTAYINLQLMGKAEQILGLDLLDREDFYNDLKILQEGAKSRPLNLVVNLVFTLRDLITLLALSLLLASYALWLPLALLLSAFPLARATLHLREVGWRALVSRSQDARAMEYHSRLALGPDLAHEVRLFGLFPWLRERYAQRFEASHTTMRRVRVQEMSRTVVPMLVSLAATGAAFAWVVHASLAGAFTVGVVVVVLQGIIQMQSTVQSFIESVGYLLERSLFFDHYFRFLEAESRVQNPKAPLPLPPTPDIVFEKVSFRYPDGRIALRDVTFHIPYGKTMALVGENGAGKTTLVKLLLRFYDPTEGRILVGGRDLRLYAVEDWRKRVAAIFQDFGRYAFSVAENIGIGALERAANRDALEQIAQQTGFDAVVKDLPKGYDTLLGKEFGGTDLSGGQWQKLAITRALFRQAEFLILDEPTAALDPRTEHELYRSFAALAKGRTTLLITHRLASARVADRILVLKEGRLVESGTHSELLARRGEYFQLWTLQASKYSDQPADVLEGLHER